MGLFHIRSKTIKICGAVRIFTPIPPVGHACPSASQNIYLYLYPQRQRMPAASYFRAICASIVQLAACKTNKGSAVSS